MLKKLWRMFTFQPHPDFYPYDLIFQQQNLNLFRGSFQDYELAILKAHLEDCQNAYYKNLWNTGIPNDIY